MKYYIEMLDWRADSFKRARHILGLSLSEVLGMLDDSYHMDDLIDSEIVDSDLPIKRILAYIYNELLISRPIYFGLEGKPENFRMHSEYVNYKKLTPKPTT